MAEETKVEVPVPEQKMLTDFKGSRAEQLKAKTAFITKWGLAEYEKLVIRSTDAKFQK